jgi:hypothetical protein
MFAEGYFKDHMWIWDGKPHWAYNTGVHETDSLTGNQLNGRQMLSPHLSLSPGILRLIKLRSNTP